MTLLESLDVLNCVFVPPLDDEVVLGVSTAANWSLAIESSDTSIVSAGGGVGADGENSGSAVESREGSVRLVAVGRGVGVFSGRLVGNGVGVG
ncbi:MAG: hypothetical protein RL326_715 [Pseudomonadota bacterium]